MHDILRCPSPDKEMIPWSFSMRPPEGTVKLCFENTSCTRPVCMLACLSLGCLEKKVFISSSILFWRHTSQIQFPSVLEWELVQHPKILWGELWADRSYYFSALITKLASPCSDCFCFLFFLWNFFKQGNVILWKVDSQLLLLSFRKSWINYKRVNDRGCDI